MIRKLKTGWNLYRKNLKVKMVVYIILAVVALVLVLYPYIRKNCGNKKTPAGGTITTTQDVQ